MKIIFVGTPKIACKTLSQIIKKHEVVAILTQTDKPQGRSKIPVPSDVACIGELSGIKIFKSEKNDPELIESLRSLNADLFIVFAYGVILKKEFLDITRFGGINIHPSLLPKYRGSSPMQSAILNGDIESGITIQTINLKVDSGDILYQRTFNISEDDDIVSIEEKVSEMSGEMMVNFLDDFERGLILPVKQDETNVSFCRMFKKEDGLIDWNESGKNILNKIRAFVKWPVAYTFLEGKKLQIYRAKLLNDSDFDEYIGCENGEIIEASNKIGIVIKVKDCFLNLITLQLEGKKILEYRDFLNGQKNLAGKKLNNGEEKNG